MSDDFYTMVDSGDPAPDNEHITGVREERAEGEQTTTQAPKAMYAARIAVYDDMLSTPRVIVIDPQDVRTYLEETTNTVYQCMKEQGGHISLMVIREIVENFIHAHFAEPIISILDGGDTIRFADQGPGIDDKERAFDFGVTSANSKMKRYIRGTGAGFPMVQEYLENAGGAVSIEDNMGNGTVVTVSLNLNACRKSSVPADAALPCGPRRSSHISPAGSFCAAARGNAADAAPRGTDAAARNASHTRTPAHLCRCRQTCQRPCRWLIRMQQQCSRRRGRRVASKWAISRTNRDIHISRCRHWGMASSSRSSTSRDISSRTSRCRSSSTTPGPADASAALPTVASKFSTANAADAEFSTTSSSNDVS